MCSQSVLIAVLALAVVGTHGYAIYQADDGDHSMLRLRRSTPEDESTSYEYIEEVPMYRVRRQTVFGGVTPGNPGATATVGASQNIFNSNGHSLDAHGQVSRTFHPTGQTSIGTGLDYQGPRGGASATVDHTRHFGTDVGVQGNANIWRSNNGRSTLDGTANYNRHFGGPFGTGRPNYGAGLQFTHRF